MTLYLYVPQLPNEPAFYSPILKHDKATTDRYKIFSLAEDNIAELQRATPLRDGWETCNYYPDSVELEQTMTDTDCDAPSVDKGRDD